MNENVINTALIACVFMGIANVAAMAKCAIRNKQRELSKTAKIWLKIFSLLCVLLAVSSVISSVSNYSLINQHTYSSYGNYHQLEYGRLCVGSLTFGFIFLGLAFYCFLFKSSKSTFVVKCLKVLLLFFMVFLYWLPVTFYPDTIGLYLFNIGLIIFNIGLFNSSSDKTAASSHENNMEPKSEFCDTTENKDNITATEPTNRETAENNDIIPSAPKTEMTAFAFEGHYNFCRFCGNKLIVGDKFCRNCGNSIH